ncbi:diguanylate cyclase [Actinoallomurus acaciae]|uniref:Diguanylate cyclase n=1 Tax=Actinoallomurus acaciae TaxID=502577 RepID=A0ABV5Y7S9_9ACTN
MKNVREMLPMDVRRSLGVEAATRRALIGGVLPLWLGAGLADWYRHRQTRIEDTAGARESAIHLLMMGEAGVPIMLGLFCEVNAGVLLTSFAALGVHEATAYWDQAYAEPRRRVTPVEQHIHSLLEIVPLMATGFLTVLHWDQACALVTKGRKGSRFALRRKRRDPLSGRTKAGLIGAMLMFGAIPYGEELWRCLRARPTLGTAPEPAEPATETLRRPETHSSRR